MWVYASQDDAFGPRSRSRHGSAKGGCYPERDHFALIAENQNSQKDAKATIQNEVMVHKGLTILVG